MLLDQATSRNVSRAINEINAFEWEGDFKPLARQALKELLENRLEQELAQYLGVSRYEHASDRHDYRNGHYVRHLLTEMGDLELLVPRSRKGKFPSRLLERYARRCRSVDRVLLACFCLGLSTRKAAAVLAPVLGEKVSASTISRIARGLDQEVSNYHSRALKDQYQYLFFDGVVLKSKGAVKVQKKILLCAFGITLEGRHEMIDFYPAASESGACWEAFLNDLYKRGFKGKPVCIDRHRWRHGIASGLADRLSQDSFAALLGAQDSKRFGQSEKERSAGGQQGFKPNQPCG